MRRCPVVVGREIDALSVQGASPSIMVGGGPGCEGCWCVMSLVFVQRLSRISLRCRDDLRGNAPYVRSVQM